MPVITPSRTQDAAARARGLAAKRGGATKQAAAARARRLTRREQLERWLRTVLAQLHPGAVAFPADEPGVWRVLAEASGERERDLTKVAKEIGVWPWSAPAIVNAVGRRHGLPDVWEGADDE